ncbi:Ricin-type beta-trefoil lectin domain-like [Mycena kentingensis (nom. inval.)]|nr:Ricin-type beta-trefoil lectin domain-like [Mycena kentingensis (nom. inval.)]
MRGHFWGIYTRWAAFRGSALTMLNALVSLALLASFASATPWLPTLRGCATSITQGGRTYALTYTTTYSQFIECDYNVPGGPSEEPTAYCFYDFHNYTLYSFPNTPTTLPQGTPGAGLPGPFDSSPSCPTVTPNAGKYLIKTREDGLCVTATGSVNGARVAVRPCDYRHGNPAQKWLFDGSLVKLTAGDSGFATDKCVDVIDGVAVSGTKLQTWDCVAQGGAANQQFSHWGRDTVVIVPTDFIGWMVHPGLCWDLTDGVEADGQPVQVWACDIQNQNQVWYLEPVV